jgi:hypothetical protein
VADPKSWRPVILTGVTALVTVVGIDAALHLVAPPKVMGVFLLIYAPVGGGTFIYTQF